MSWTLRQIFCKHRKEIIHDKHHMMCLNCGALRRLPDNLTIASGVFDRIEKRMEQDAEYTRLVRLGESYFADKEFNHDYR